MTTLVDAAERVRATKARMEQLRHNKELFANQLVRVERDLRESEREYQDAVQMLLAAAEL